MDFQTDEKPKEEKAASSSSYSDPLDDLLDDIAIEDAIAYSAARLDENAAAIAFFRKLAALEQDYAQALSRLKPPLAAVDNEAEAEHRLFHVIHALQLLRGGVVAHIGTAVHSDLWKSIRSILA